VGLNRIFIQTNYALNSLGNLNSLKNLTGLYAFCCDLTNIDGLEELTALKKLSLYSNINLVNVSVLGGLSGLNEIYLANNDLMDGNQLAAALQDTGILAQCGTNYSIPQSILDSYFTIILADYNFTGKSDEYITQMINTFKTRDLSAIQKIDMSGCSSISNADLQAVLSRMKNLKYLYLKNCSNLTSIDFVKGEYTDSISGKTVKAPLSQLDELDLRGVGTSLTDLSLLNSCCPVIGSLIVNNPNIDFSGIATTINGPLFTNYTNNSTKRKFASATTWENFGGLVLTGNASNYDLNGSAGGNFEGITNLAISSNWRSNEKNGISQSGTLDLSSTKIEEYYTRSCGYKLLLPNTLKSFYCINLSKTFNFSTGTELDFCDIDYVASDVCLTALKDLKKLPIELKVQRKGLTSFSYLNETDNEGNYIYDSSATLKIAIGFTNNSNWAYLENLDGFERFQNLTSLKLRPCSQLNNLENITKLSNLIELELYSDKPESCSTVYLASGTYVLTKLETLTIKNCSTIKNIVGMDRISSLKSVTLSFTSISNISGLSNQVGLTTLVLNNNKITDLSELDSLITNVGGNLGFSELDLYYNGIVLFSGAHENANTIENLLNHGVNKITLYSGDEIASSSKLSGKSGVIIK